MQDSQADCVWEIGRTTSSPPDPVEDPEMSETVAQERHEERSYVILILKANIVAASYTVWSILRTRYC